MASLYEIMINFIEHEHTGYALRTRDNAALADGTIGFAINFNSSGMILTSKVNYNKVYIKVDPNEYSPLGVKDAQAIANELRDKNIRHLNVAGNSLYSLRSKYTQDGIDARVSEVLTKVNAFYQIKEVRCGGQSGVDEAAAKWADSIGIPCTVLAPKGWMFRTGRGIDVCNEHGFIKRFGSQYDMSDFI